MEMIRTIRAMMRILSDTARMRINWIIGLSIVTALMEIITVSLIGPFLVLIVGEQVDSRAVSLIGGLRPEGVSLTHFVGLCVIASLVMTNGLLILLSYLRAKTIWSVVHELGTGLLGRYLRRRYAYFLGTNPSGVVKNVLQEVEQSCIQVAEPALAVLSKGIVVVVMIGLFISMDPVVALCAALLLGGSYAALYGSVRGIIKRAGKVRADSNKARYQIAQDSLGSLKEAQIFGTTDLFLDVYDKPSRQYTESAAKTRFLAGVPRFLLETLLIGGLITFALLTMGDGVSLGEVGSQIASYVFLGYRLLPNLQQTYSAILRMRFMMHVVNNLLSDWRESEDDRIPAASETVPQMRQAIALKDVSFTYPGAEQPAFDKITLTIPNGARVAIVGESGSGKSTLLDIIIGALQPSSGELLIDGLALKDANLKSWQEQIGYVPQTIFTLDASVAENISFMRETTGTDSITRAAELSDLSKVVKNLPQGFETRLGGIGNRLSGGQRQRLALARAFYLKRNVLVLDEATSALDDATEAKVIKNAVAESGASTIILVTHRMTTIEDFDIIYRVEAGVVRVERGAELLQERAVS